MNTLPPDDSTPETRRWEAWAGTVKVSDRCRVAGVLATVTHITEGYLWARIDGQTDTLPRAWEDCDEVGS